MKHNLVKKKLFFILLFNIFYMISEPLSFVLVALSHWIIPAIPSSDYPIKSLTLPSVFPTVRQLSANTPWHHTLSSCLLGCHRTSPSIGGIPATAHGAFHTTSSHYRQPCPTEKGEESEIFPKLFFCSFQSCHPFV